MLVTTPPFMGSSSQCEAGSCGKIHKEGRLGEKKALFSKSLGDIPITEVILNGRTCVKGRKHNQPNLFWLLS